MRKQIPADTHTRAATIYQMKKKMIAGMMKIATKVKMNYVNDKLVFFRGPMICCHFFPRCGK